MITIITDPLPVGNLFISEWAKKCGRIARDIFKPPKYNYGRFRGHYAVTRSLIEGLRKLDLPHNYNPIRISDMADTVVVLAGVGALRQAIEFKRKGYYNKLFAGPNIMNFSSDYNFMLASPEVNAVITPSQHVVDHYVEDSPSLSGRCFAWPAGVDVDFWAPIPNANRKTILFYEKHKQGDVDILTPYVRYILQKGYEVEIIRYGFFKQRDFLLSLQRAQLMIGFPLNGAESQGIAWAESWSMDVPTMIWRNEINTFLGRTYRCSTAPYLNDQTGLFFDSIEDFKYKFALWENKKVQFTPRNWTLLNMSDEVCARQLYQKITQC